MARQVKTKELVNTRLATNYGGWMYCGQCNENIGYLCYSTYDRVELKYQCNCKNEGSILIDFVDSEKGNKCEDELVKMKNRLCCAKDQEPLITLLDNKLIHYQMNILCKSCGSIYKKVK